MSLHDIANRCQQLEVINIGKRKFILKKDIKNEVYQVVERVQISNLPSSSPGYGLESITFMSERKFLEFRKSLINL